MPCISERARSAAAGRSRPSLAGPVLRWPRPSVPRGSKIAVLDLGAHEALVAGELRLGKHLLHTDCYLLASLRFRRPMLPGPAMPPDASTASRAPAAGGPARSTFSGVSISDWSSISPSRQSSNSSWRMNLSERIVGASVIGLVPFRWYVYAAM